MSQKLKERVRKCDYFVSYNPPGDGNCFYVAVAYQLGISSNVGKEMVFQFLEDNRINVSQLYL